MASGNTEPSNDAKEEWEPMEIRYLGNVGEVVQAGGDKSDRHRHRHGGW